MRVCFTYLLLWAGLAGLAAGVSAQEAQDGSVALRGYLADPAFRLKAGQPGSGKSFAMEAIPEEARQADYDWLRNTVKASPEQAVECRLLSWLARDLRRPAEEIQRADDLVLQAAPDLPEGWLNRAEFYAVAAEQAPEKADWALDTFAQGLRRVNFALPDWRSALAGVDVNAWIERAAKAGKLALLGDALADAMHATPRDQASLDAANFIRSLLQSRTFRDDPSVGEKLLDAMEIAQPHLALGDALGYMEMARTFEAEGKRGLAERTARLLALGPVTEEVAVSENVSRSGFTLQWNHDHPRPELPETATPLQVAEHELALSAHEAKGQQAYKLRAGWLSLQLAWEDTMPRYLPMTQARELLRLAVGNDTAAFADIAVNVARDQPWNESLISFALVSSAITDELPESLLALTERMDVEARLRMALRLHAFAPADHLPHSAIGPWLMDGGMRMLNALAEGETLEQRDFSTLLQILEAFGRAKDFNRLHGLLAETVAKPPRPELAEYWRQLSALVLRHGTEEQVISFAKTWEERLANYSGDDAHLTAIAAAAVRGGVTRGKGYADLARQIWYRRFGENPERNMTDAVATARVSEALLACEQQVEFGDLVKWIQRKPGINNYATFSRLTKELTALHELLTGEGTRLPAVDAWVQAPEQDGGAPRVQWRFVLPELDSLAAHTAPIRLAIVVGGREAAANQSVEETEDARWWKAGTPHPLLRNLTGRYDLTISAGINPQQLRSVATVKQAGNEGSAEVAQLAPSGCVRVILQSQGSATVGQGEARLYSLRPALFSTGREPEAQSREPAVGPVLADQPSPATWTHFDDERWGRLIGPPIAIEDGVEYLFTRFAPPDASGDKVLPADLILLDERQRPLGVVPLVSTGFHSGSPLTATYTQHFANTQRFRASDWGWAEDEVGYREKTLAKAEQTIPARYMAVASRSKGEGVVPIMQLRRYREPAGGTAADAASVSELTQMPELNGEFVATLGFRARSWHITMGPQRGVFGGEGRMAGFDVTRIPWKPLMRIQSHLLLGNEWPMVFASERALVVEPSWTGDRRLGLRFVPFTKESESYGACERKDLPMRSYTRGELSINHDGALMMLASESREKPEPVAGWLFPDGKLSVCPLPRGPLVGEAGLELAWWGPPANQFTLHEDHVLFEMEVTDELRLVSSRPGSPDDMPEDATPPKSKKKPQWRLERPDILTEHDTTTGVMVRRFHLPQPCEAKPMSFSEDSPVFLYTVEHDIIRVNPPPRKRR